MTSPAVEISVSVISPCVNASTAVAIFSAELAALFPIAIHCVSCLYFKLVRIGANDSLTVDSFLTNGFSTSCI